MIPDPRRKEVLAWLDDRARDYGLSHREIALARDAASLIREHDAKPGQMDKVNGDQQSSLVGATQ